MSATDKDGHLINSDLSPISKGDLRLVVCPFLFGLAFKDNEERPAVVHSTDSTPGN